MNRAIILLATVLIMNQFQCGGQKKVDIKNDLSAIKQIPAEKWELLKTKKLYFGHQSVGFNIIEGIELIMLEIPELSLNIKETKSASDFKSSIFAHSAVGENKDPFSKIMDFKNIMHSGVGDSVDYAFFKFCYIDIKEDTDVRRVFATYKKVLDSLEMRFPNTTFIHVTVPLRVAQTGIKVFIKKLIDRPIGGYADNIKRNEFNQFLLNEYGESGLVFDLAKAESTFPDGSRQTFESNGESYSFLIPAYTHDGGHLNKIGRTVIAEKLLLFLANTINTTDQ